MKPELNIFSQAFAAIVECWRYFFGFIAVIFILETVGILYDLGNGLTVARAFVESGIVFYLCATLMGLDLKSKDTGKKYSGFMLRYLLLLYLPVIVISLAVVFSVVPVFPRGSQGQDVALAIIFFAGGAAVLLTTFLFGTVFPAHLIGVSNGIGASVGRSFRQAAYLIPRLLFGSGSIAGLAMAILIFFENIGVGSDLITPAGTLNIPGGLVLLAAKLMAGYGFALFSVIVCRAYLKDLKERGELPVAEADVFA